MSYDACDFLENCEEMANAYDVPEASREYWNSLGYDEDEVTADDWKDYCNGEDGQRVLAERVGIAFNQRRELLAALESLLAAAEGAGNAWDAMNVARKAIQEART